MSNEVTIPISIVEVIKNHKISSERYSRAMCKKDAEMINYYGEQMRLQEKAIVFNLEKLIKKT